MKTLLVLLLLTCIAHAEQTFSGFDKNCHEIGGYSTPCLHHAKMLPLYMTDKKTAQIKANTPETVNNYTTNTKTVNKTYFEAKSDNPEVIAKMYVEE